MRILFVTPRVPYPLDTGAKIRTFNLIKQAQSYGNRVTLCTFIFSESDSKSADVLRSMGIEVECVFSKDKIDISTIFKAFFHGIPLSVAKYHSSKMRSLVDSIVSKNQIDIVHFDHVHLSQYMDFSKKLIYAIDEHNIESVILKRCFEKEKNLIKRLVYSAEYKKMEKYEISQCIKARKTFVVSENDKDTLTNICKGKADIALIPNGVDRDYFSSEEQGVYQQEDSIVFVGSMDWLPNGDAVKYFIKDILPFFNDFKKDIKFYVVGKNPDKSLTAMVKSDKRIILTGTVPDVRPYIRRSKVFVVPLRIGGGTRLKILEALSLRKAVVSTSIGSEGLCLEDKKHLLIADCPGDFAKCIIRLIEDSRLRDTLGKNGRDFVKEFYDWKVIGEKLNKAYESLGSVKKGVKKCLIRTS
ncbi:MAG: glycosyltransferase family 4 protein [Candidatus Omnitrophota bacterium]